MGGASKDKKTLDRVDLKGKYGRWRSPDNGLLKEWIAAVPSTLPPPLYPLFRFTLGGERYGPT